MCNDNQSILGSGPATVTGAISISVLPFVEEVIARLLKYYFHPSSPDEFDKYASFVVAYLADEPVGMIRLTTGTYGPLQKWSIKGPLLPSGDDVVQLTRAVVATQFRENGIFKRMMFAALDHSAGTGARLAVAAVEPSSVHRKLLDDVGFSVVSSSTFYAYAPGKTAHLLSMIYDFREYLAPGRFCLTIGAAILEGSLYTIGPRKDRFIVGSLIVAGFVRASFSGSTRKPTFINVKIGALTQTICLRFDSDRQKFMTAWVFSNGQPIVPEQWQTVVSLETAS